MDSMNCYRRAMFVGCYRTFNLIKLIMTLLEYSIVHCYHDNGRNPERYRTRNHGINLINEKHAFIGMLVHKYLKKIKLLYLKEVLTA